MGESREEDLVRAGSEGQAALEALVEELRIDAVLGECFDFVEVRGLGIAEEQPDERADLRDDRWKARLGEGIAHAGS